jgi:hypothetical protein
VALELKGGCEAGVVVLLEGRIEFPYTAVYVDYMMKAAA